MSVPIIFAVVTLVIGFAAGAYWTLVFLAALLINEDQQPPTEASDE